MPDPAARTPVDSRDEAQARHDPPTQTLMMEATARRWGSSVGLVIPATVAEALAIQDGTALRLQVHGSGFSVEPKPVYPGLDDLLASIPDGEPADGGFGWGEPVGEEAW